MMFSILLQNGCRLRCAFPQDDREATQNFNVASVVTSILEALLGSPVRTLSNVRGGAGNEPSNTLTGVLLLLAGS